MSILNLTGTEGVRFLEIQKSWLNFECLTNEEFSIKSYLYSVPLGQDFAAEYLIITGSGFNQSGSITIIKDIHLFDSEQEASRFIGEVGIKNIIAYKETITNNQTWFEVHLVNFPIVKFENKNINTFNQLGFKIEVFLSSSEGLVPTEKIPQFDNQNRIINDTYLKYFSIEVEK